MIEQIEFGTPSEYLLAEESTARGVAAVVADLNDQLTVICGLAHMGAEVSYHVELTENYFAQIESAGKKAAQITRHLLVLDPPQPAAGEHPAAMGRPAASSFRRRVTAPR